MRRSRAFTLLELVVVVGLLGLIASMTVPLLRTSPNAGADTSAAIDATTHAIELYRLDNGQYPGSLDDLLHRPAGVRTWKPRLRAVPVDGWNHMLAYKSPTEHSPYEVRSAGPDGLLQTTDDIVATGHASR